MTSDRWFLTSSEISIFHASHVWGPIPRWKWLSPTMKNRDLGPLGPSNLDPIYVIQVFGSTLSCILCERQKFSESHKLKRFGSRNQFRAARFVTVFIIARSISAMKWVVENYCVCGLGTTNSREMTSDRWFLTSSEISIFHASHVWGPIPRWKWPSRTIQNRGLGPLGPSILDPIYVIYAFGSMLSCILWERQKFSEISSEERDLWPFRLLDVLWMQWDWRSGISLLVV